MTAKAKEAFENEKFAMRVWLIGLGLVGKEFGLARKLLMANLGGNSSWRYGAPDKAAQEVDTAPECAEPGATEAVSEPAPAEAGDAEVGGDA